MAVVLRQRIGSVNVDFIMFLLVITVFYLCAAGIARGMNKVTIGSGASAGYGQ